MKVAMYYNNKDIRIQEMPIPRIGDNEILVKVVASGICGSDVMEWYRIKKAPRVLGHEITGDIVEVGKNVKNYKAGKRVFVSHHVPCGTCKYCISNNHTCCKTLHNTNYDPGGFAEYIRVPEINVKNGVFILPNEISYEEGVFIEPLACVIRAQKKLQIKNNIVLVQGCGISGILHILLARISGAKYIIATDINRYRLNLAKKFGADKAIYSDKNLPEKIKKLYLPDIVIVCTGSYSALTQALQVVDEGGTILFFAPTDPQFQLSFPFNNFWWKQIKILSSYAASPFDIKEAIELLKTKRITAKEMITHRLSLENISRGFQIVKDAKRSLKVIINMT